MSIDKLVAKIRQVGYLSPSRFLVDFGPPFDNERLSFTCESASLPGRSYSTYEHTTYGPKRLLPYNETYTNEVSLVFRVGRDMYERLMFDLWMNDIMDVYNDFAFYDRYVRDVRISVLNLDKEETPAYTVRLIEAWPSAVEDVPVSFDLTDQTLKINVKLTFHRWEMVPPGSISSGQRYRPGLFLTGNAVDGQAAGTQLLVDPFQNSSSLNSSGSLFGGGNGPFIESSRGNGIMEFSGEPKYTIGEGVTFNARAVNGAVVQNSQSQPYLTSTDRLNVGSQSQLNQVAASYKNA